MISDKSVLGEVRASWGGVEALRDKLQGALLGSLVQGPTFAIFMADAAHNLPFIFACSALNDTLEQLSKEGYFKCGGFFLRPLLKASEHKLVWKDFALIKEAAKRRKAVAHKGKILPRADCWKYIDAVREQLLAWKVLDASEL